MRHRGNEQARIRLSHRNARPSIATAQQHGAIVCAQPAFDVLARRTVALIAVLDEDRTYPLFEKLDVCGDGLSVRRPQSRCDHKSVS